jgi:hypothetical protein
MDNKVRPKDVEVDRRNKLKIYNTSSWFLLQRIEPCIIIKVVTFIHSFCCLPYDMSIASSKVNSPPNAI